MKCENRMRPQIVWLRGKVWKSHTLPAMWCIWVDLESWGWQVSLEGSTGALKMSIFPSKYLIYFSSSPRAARMGLCDAKAHTGPQWLGMWLPDLIKHKGMTPLGGLYTYGCSGALEQTSGSLQNNKGDGSHTALVQLWNSWLHTPRTKRWSSSVNWSPK